MGCDYLRGLSSYPLSEVSIHAPRVGCDHRRGCPPHRTRGFNSRTPCGVRQHIALASTKPISFNSRTPCGVRHKERPRATAQRTSFNSRTPCGVRRTYSAKPLPPTSVSIHAPRVGCDRSLVYTSTYLLVSIHAPRVGCDIVKIIKACFWTVSIHAPRVGCDL